MQTYPLTAHPAEPSSSVRSVRAEIGLSDDTRSRISYYVEPAGKLLLARPALPGRADELWKTTCFELFLEHPDGAGYREYNFSPSGQWAAYDLDSYREGMKRADVAREPLIAAVMDKDGFRLDVDLDLGWMGGETVWANLTAVIEEVDGTKSYWAVAHVPGKPDFHHPSCFAIPLAPPETP